MSELKNRNPLLEQPLEIRMWLENQCREDFTAEEILTLFNEKFPFVSGVTTRHISAYRKKAVPNYKELLLQRYGKEKEKPHNEIEDEILAEVREAKETDEEFIKDDKNKINILKAARIILKEMWNNYKSVKTTSDENAKRQYLVEAMKALMIIKEQEGVERSFSSAMDEIRKAESRMSTEKYLDSIEGWFFPRCIERAGNKEDAFKAIEALKTYLEEYKQILEKTTNKEEAQKEILAKLYVNKRIRDENELTPKSEEEKRGGPLPEAVAN